MAEGSRKNIRKVMSQATSISLAFDESKYRKVVRYRADLPSKSSAPGSICRSIGASGFSHSGVLGILDCTKKHAVDFEDDHAVTAMKQFDSFLTRFCTPLGRVNGRRQRHRLVCNQDLKAHVMKTVTSISADGAAKERRAVFLAAREIFPNALIVIRDPAHAIRIAIKALHLDDVFGQVWNDLFNDRHALVPDLMNSSKWHNLLVAIQEDNIQAVARPGVPQPLAGVVRNVAFAKQRFDSTAGPVGKIALMLLPVATLLAYVASDMRHERDQRERASALLKKLDGKCCAAIAASADWGIVCNWFLRLFDVAGHDIAKSRSEIDCMIETLDAVFVKGCLFKRLFDPVAVAACRVSGSAADLEPLPRIHAAVSDAENKVGFITAKVMHNLRSRYVFYAGGVPVLLWGDLTSADKGELLERLKNVASLTKERLLADFPRDDVRSALAMFDRRLVRKGFGPLPDPEVRRFLLRGVRALAALLGCEAQAAILQYNGVLPYMLEQMEESHPLADKTNQQAWALLLDDHFWEAACPKRLSAASGALSRIIRFYISIEDGECTVERDLGEYRAHVMEHRTNDIDFLDDALLVKLNGPKTMKEFDGGVAHLEILLTPYSRQCASLWRELFGVRFGHYNAAATSAAKLKRKMAPGAFRGVTLGVLAAARLAVASMRRRAGQAPRPGGVAKSGTGSVDGSLWSDAMRKFQHRSSHNIPGTTQVRRRIGASFVNPAGVRLAARQGARAQPLARAVPYSPRVAMVGVKEDVCVARECRIRVGTHRCAEADLVVVPDLALLHDVDALAANVDLAVSFLYIVLLGAVVAAKAWLSSVQGVPRRLASQHCVHHARAGTQTLTFFVGERLRLEQADVHTALRRIARMPGSKITLSTKPRPDSGDIVFHDLRDVVAWSCAARRVVNERGPKVRTTSGVQMPA